MARTLVIADDFTGALDTGIQFAKNGIQTQILLDYENALEKFNKNVQVIVIDSETRHMPPEKAGEKIEKIILSARENDVDMVYKKTDSALRGNIGSELSALLGASGEKALFYIPAFPKVGRTTQNGVQYIDHVPVSESVFGRDPFEPVNCSYIPDIIASQSKVNVRVVRKGELERRFFMSPEPTIYVVDAEKTGDLQKIAGKVKSMNVKLLAGCAGFAEFLPVLWEEEGWDQKLEKTDGLIVISGSMNPITIRQIRKARKQGVPCFTLDETQRTWEEYGKSIKFLEFLRELEKTYKEEKRMIIEASDSFNEEKGSRSFSEVRAGRQQVAANMAEIANGLVQKGIKGVYVIIGGDTLEAIMKRVGCKKIIPLKELMPGVVYSKVYSESGELSVISKSGGLGEEDVLVRLLCKNGAGEADGRDEIAFG